VSASPDFRPALVAADLMRAAAELVALAAVPPPPSADLAAHLFSREEAAVVLSLADSPATQRDVSEKVGIHETTVGHICRQLKARGVLVERGQHVLSVARPLFVEVARQVLAV
jgi:DNA-binding MarR family transcriptional regulator